jgi:4a-hydroxytetrahydrobiopterin dehydratase
MSTIWQERKRPTRLEARFEFDSYSKLRDFLDAAADLSEKMDYYPNIGFGNNYANITIYAEDEKGDLSEVQHEFAKSIEQLID